MHEILLEVSSKPIVEQIKIFMAVKPGSFVDQCIQDPLKYAYQLGRKKLKVAKKADKSKKFVCGLSRKLC